MKLSVKLRPTVEGRSSEISGLLSPPLLSFEGRCFLGGEDGENGKDKNSDDPAESASGDGDDADDQTLDNRSTSSHSSRSPTPSEVTAPPPPPAPLLPVSDPPKQELEMDLVNKVPIMDISRNAVANPELIQTADDDEEDGEEDLGGTEEDAPLDFSVKRATEDESTDDDRSITPNGLHPPSISQDGPLDLSVSHRRSSRGHDRSRQPKMAKLETALSMPSSPWGYNAPKHSSKLLAAKAAITEVPMWNGKVKTEKRDKNLITNAAAKSAPLNRSAVYHPLLQKNASPPLDTLRMNEIRKQGGSKSDPYRPAGRQNPWQSQWMSRSSEQARDVFTCVWCKESFRSLDDMTIHMKQSPRCGMAGMQSNLPSASPVGSSMNHQQSSHHSAMPAKCSSSSASAGPAANAVVKENISLPRKLVRGQDVWLGKGAEQTRQILKCMWCGQSFKTLADMTTHMRVTQHYTNIISQEQIISWRTPEDKMAAQSQVNAVLTCKVCDQAFGSLKELSYHMVKNSHYKEHILRSITEGGGRRRQTRERRKKSLPVRKLLELERMELNKQDPTSSNDLSNQAKNEVVDGKISCEECTEKVDAKDFVQHIKNCAQGSRSQQSVKSSPSSEGAKSISAADIADAPTTSGTGARTNSSPLSSQETASEETNKTGQVIQQDDSMCDSVESTGSTSVLNAIEKLIEKSFESKGRRNTVSTGILQRLGIDEEVYPPWHPSSSPSAFGVLRSSVDLQRKSTSPLGRLHDYKMELADFSGSESRSRSSSISEKHPSFDDHLRLSFGLTSKDVLNRVSTPSSASQSCSPVHFQPESPAEDRNSVFTTKEAASSNQASTSQADASQIVASPKDRSVTPSSDRDTTEKNTAKESGQNSPLKETVTVKREPEEASAEDHADKPLASESEKAIDCSREPTPKSEDRHTPVSRSSSVEPEAALAASPVTPVPVSESPTKPHKSGSRKRKNSEVHRKSQSSSSKRRSSHTGREKDSEMGNDMDSAMDSPMSTHSSEVTSPRRKHSDASASDHPLKELQKLLDKTDAHLSRPSLPATPGSILAFSWACSEATTSDSLMKCAFCDTCFISKGAYRHHLSKMHFVKDGSLAEIAAASTWKPPSSSGNKSTAPSGSSSSSNGVAVSASNRASNNNSDPGLRNSPQKELAPPAPVDESPHSKFLKYTELAKQLSSKYV